MLGCSSVPESLLENTQTDCQGNRITPSYVAFVPESGERLVGDAAKNQAPQNVSPFSFARFRYLLLSVNLSGFF